MLQKQCVCVCVATCWVWVVSPAAVGISNFSSNNSTIGTRVFPDICTYLHILSVHRTTLQDNRHDGVSNYTGISCRCSHFFLYRAGIPCRAPSKSKFSSGDRNSRVCLLRSHSRSREKLYAACIPTWWTCTHIFSHFLGGNNWSVVAKGATE